MKSFFYLFLAAVILTGCNQDAKKLTKEEKTVLATVMAYAPPPRKYRRKELFSDLILYVKEHGKALHRIKNSQLLNWPARVTLWNPF